MLDIVDAISNRLYDIFGDAYPIHLESVEQDFKPNSFFIHPVYASDKNLIHNRKYRTVEFDLVFIPEDNEPRKTMTIVSDKLFSSFDFVVLEDGTILRTFNRNIDVVNNMLHFRITFKFDYFAEIPEEELQESIEMSVIIDGT